MARGGERQEWGGSGGEIRRKKEWKRKGERKNERADNKRLTSRLSEWWNFKTPPDQIIYPCL